MSKQIEALKTIKSMLECQFTGDGKTQGIHSAYMRTLISICDQAIPKEIIDLKPLCHECGKTNDHYYGSINLTGSCEICGRPGMYCTRTLRKKDG